MHERKKIKECFIKFDEPIQGIPLPTQFTYPFYYEPHPLTLLAAKQLQQHLATQTDWRHDFGIDHFVDGVNVGKMFGVLVVRKENGELGFLAAFSGRLGDSGNQPQFVPPVVDYLAEDSFFRKGEQEIEHLSAEIAVMESSENYLNIKNYYEETIRSAEEKLAELKVNQKNRKQSRKLRRAELVGSSPGTDQLLEELNQESKDDHFVLKDKKAFWQAKVYEAKTKFDLEHSKLLLLKKKRRKRSVELQNELFDAYQLLNANGNAKGLREIFDAQGIEVPPSGAGECAMPKLLQFAFLNQLQPIAMAEFWWGQSPKSEIRKHGQFYPSCKGKCEPILKHMLQGMDVAPSPMENVSTFEKTLDVIYEDETLLVINKPHEFLSVPGKTNADSVYQRMRQRFPKATGPMMVHRLDRATSGLMVIAKTKEVHQELQTQFLTKEVRKQYVALLEGKLEAEEGVIDLPLRVDLEDRPRQLVCFEHGKPALTHWKVLDKKSVRTRIQFFPVTGRTHQLRVHAAHQQGLNIPIVGDDLYGQRDTRLHLHAEALSFVHPASLKRMHFSVEAEF